MAMPSDMVSKRKRKESKKPLEYACRERRVGERKERSKKELEQEVGMK
jgi:hypothetical protein